MTGSNPASTPPLRVTLEADGGSRGNPGIAGYGTVLRDSATGQVLAERCGAIGIATNNVAEYSGLIAGLEAAVEIGAVDVDVRMDSKLVIEQMAGRWKIKHPGLRQLATAAAALVSRFETVRFSWIPREQNRHADALANVAMDGGPCPSGGTSAAGAGAGGGPSASGAAGGPSVSGPAAGGASASGAGAGSARSWNPPAATTALRLVLVRHGVTELTAGGRYSGRGEVPLSPQGTAQAEAAARRVAALGTPVTALLTSPLVRCVGTAQAIAAAVGTGATAEPDIVECDFGDWEGLTFAEVSERYAAEHAAWLASTAVGPPGGESFQQVALRVRGFVARLQETYPQGTVVVVSHVSPIKVILQDALAAGDAFLHRCYLSPAGISVVDFYPDGGIAVRTVNDTAHLAA